MAALGDGHAMFAVAAGVGRRAALAVGADAVHALGDDPRGGGLAGAADAGQDEGLRDAVGLERVLQGAHHGVLADQVGKGFGPVFAGQNLVGGGGVGHGRQTRRLAGGGPAGPLIAERLTGACRLPSGGGIRVGGWPIPAPIDPTDITTVELILGQRNNGRDMRDADETLYRTGSRGEGAENGVCGWRSRGEDAGCCRTAGAEARHGQVVEEGVS